MTFREMLNDSDILIDNLVEVKYKLGGDTRLVRGLLCGITESSIEVLLEDGTSRYVSDYNIVSIQNINNGETDMVNHPQHYKSESGLEVIDVIKAFTAELKGYQATDTGNVIKYILRWPHKNGLEDLKKAQWYLNDLINTIEEEQEKDHKSEPKETVTHNCTCPKCWKSLIRLEPYEDGVFNYWCDECNIDISINEKGESK